MAGSMLRHLTAPQLLDREFLEVRAKILEIAAALDRWQRAEGSLDGDPRRQRIGTALEMLTAHEVDRAERIQLLFSRPYEPDWRDRFSLPTS
jgi:hypothetical protein